MRNVLLATALVLSCVVAGAQVSESFFPSGAFYADFPTLDNAIVRWYSNQLTALREPSLWTASQDVHRHCYRFTWLRTWDAPIAIRLDEAENGTAILTLKVASGSGGDDPGHLEKTSTKRLTKDEFDNVVKQFGDSGFWKMPTRTQENGKDGARWVLEAAQGGKYHVVDRWSPTNGATKELALNLVRLSDYEVNKDKVY